MDTAPAQPMYVLVVNHLIDGVIETARQLRKNPKYAGLQLLVVTNTPEAYGQYKNNQSIKAIIRCDFTPGSITRALAPFLQYICAVVCRGDSHITYLRKMLPFLPERLLVSSAESLRTATHKHLMRRAFSRHFPEITPAFARITEASDMTVQTIETRLSYPVIVKPTNLASSLYIQSCNTRGELIAAVQNIRTHQDKPGDIIVEEYLEGSFYSVDAYVMDPGQIYCCPPVEYVPAKHVGVDDFALYRRFVPAGLTDSQIQEAETVVQKAVTALGLTHSSAHVELVLTAQGWKVIEVGPRVGRFRHHMYKQAYGIDHSRNDLMIHMGRTPVLARKLLKYCSAYSFYPRREGPFRGISYWDDLTRHPAFVWGLQKATPGEIAHYAKHGGRALAVAIIATDNKQAHDEAAAWIETNVMVNIDLN